MRTFRTLKTLRTLVTKEIIAYLASRNGRTYNGGITMYTSEEVLEKLQTGNAAYVASGAFGGNISSVRRKELSDKGQSPMAVVIACADSRVVPEVIFSCGLGDLFTIRIAGNVMDAHQMGSVEYAVAHLKTPLVVVLGHTHCGAVAAALHGEADGHIKYITDSIQKAIGKETNEYQACVLNVKAAVQEIHDAFSHESDPLLQHEQVVGAVYDIETGRVSFL